MTAALEGGEWSAARPDRTLPPGKDPVPILEEAGWAPGPVWTGGKSRPHRGSIPDRPARSQSLYRLSYLDRMSGINTTVKNTYKLWYNDWQVSRYWVLILYYLICGIIKFYEIAINVECAIFLDFKLLKYISLFVKRSAVRDKVICLLSVISKIYLQFE